METSTAGCRLQKAPIKRGMKYLAVLTTATFRRPRFKPRWASTDCSKASHCDTIARAVEEVASAPAGSLAKLLEESGDLGLAVEELLESERPIAGEALAAAERSAAERSAAIAVAEGSGRVGGAAERGDGPRLADLPGVFAAIRDAGGQRRHDLISQLLFGCSPIAAKYLVRLLTGDMRIGLRDGLLEAAIAEFKRQWATRGSGAKTGAKVHSTALVGSHATRYTVAAKT